MLCLSRFTLMGSDPVQSIMTHDKDENGYIVLINGFLGFVVDSWKNIFRWICCRSRRILCPKVV
jgi:hypothetical protein